MASTRSRVAALAPGASRMTIDTSAVETPARAATSARVVRRSMPTTVLERSIDEQAAVVHARSYNVLVGGDDMADVRVALIGSGRMGAFHGETLARRIPGVRLAAVADPAPGAAERLAAELGADTAYTDAAEAFASPEVDAVVIAAPARFHADLVVAAATAGKGVFCEKPMGLHAGGRGPGDRRRARRRRRAAGRLQPPLRRGLARPPAPCWTTARSAPRGWCGR